jgi:hypothetical protein
MPVRVGRRGAAAVAVLAVIVAALAGASTAFGLAAPRWQLDASAAPTNLPPGGEGQVFVLARNLGDAPVNGVSAQVSIADALPAGLTATAISGASAKPGNAAGEPEGAGPVACTQPAGPCTYAGVLAPYGRLELTISVHVAPGAISGGGNDVTISGGAAPSASLLRPLPVSGAPSAFGVGDYQLTAENEDGSSAALAGSHPFQLTTAFDLNQALVFESGFKELVPEPPALVKDVRFKLPPGLIGNPTAIPRCSDLAFAHVTLQYINLCPPDTAVGVVSARVFEPKNGPTFNFAVPLFNLEPDRGEPARFGFIATKVPVILDTSVRTGSDYGVTVSVSNISELAGLLSSSVTIWGVPGDPSHDGSRGWECLAGSPGCTALGQSRPPAFLTLPTSCSGPLASPMELDSWASPGSFLAPREPSSPVSLEGCDRLPFAPTIAVEPVEGEGRSASTPTTTASSPTGLNVDIHVPQAPTLEGEARAEADVRETTVTLPAGMQLSPSAAEGLLACTAAQIGFTGADERTQLDNHEFNASPPSCPEASKVATVEIRTPLLANPLSGAVYLAAQDTNPFGAPMVLYLVAQDPVSGVLVKLAGKVTPDPLTGQLVSSFENTPQVPFEELSLHFLGGPRGSLSTPPLCGTYATVSSFTPWSGAPPQAPSSSFPITSAPGGAPCSSPRPFAPGFDAHGANTQAAAFTPFTLSISRADGDQALATVSTTMPPGLAAMLSSVTPCGEVDAARGSCPGASLIGHSTSSSGLGSGPFTLGGQVYLTGPYRGAPFGLSIVTPAIAGPFNLGTVIVRASISVDPASAAVTVRSDPLPQIVRGVGMASSGIPTQLQYINVTVDRPGFEFNPTNCNRMAVTGTLGGSEGSSAQVSSPFQVGGCAALPFRPKLTASTTAQASKRNGASLDVKVQSAGLGQANIAKVELQLPIELPSRLTTIQKACPDSVFNVNPATCDEGSVIGSATIRTPVLKNPLSGPAYLVSHGGAAFPDVEFVLQGEGITLVLDGKTDIEKGITYSRFESAPDAPFTAFETFLPTGPHSALGVNLPASKKSNLCGSSLLMPTVITGQNGAVIRQTTKIAVTGCHGLLGFTVTKAQLLAKALKACRKDKKKSKRVACEKRARKKYGAKASKKKKK